RLESFIDEHLRVCRMVHHEQRHVIEEMCLPEFGRDTNVVDAIARPKLIARDPDPILRLTHTRGVLGCDAASKRRPPQEIGDEADLCAVPREHPRARPFETLLCDDHVVDGRSELGLRVAVRPHDSRHIDAGAGAQTEMNRSSSHDLRLDREAGAYAALSANYKRVDSLVACRRLAARPDHLAVISR